MANRPTTSFNEESVRAALRRMVAGRKEAGALLIDELGLLRGNARIDLVVVGDHLHGYEIKTGRDDLRRLVSQANLYSRVFDRVSLVCDDRHVSQALNMVPHWWEVLRIASAASGPRFKTARRGRRNPQRDVRALVELLWREAAMALLAQRRTLRGLRGKPRAHLWDSICELFKADEVGVAVRAHLRTTRPLFSVTGVKRDPGPRL